MGITRDTLINLIEDMGYQYKVDKITKDQLFDADEVFYCGSASEVTPIRSIDDHSIGSGTSGKITLELQEKYYEVVRGKHNKYFDWLTFIN